MKDSRYCAAFRVLVVRRASSTSSPAGNKDTINDRMDPALFASLTEMVDTFVSQKELEAKRRVEVYYNEEQAKVRNMHRRLKRQMSSLTEQIVKVMDAEQIYQATLNQEQSPALSIASSASSGSPETKTDATQQHSPLHLMQPHVIQIPDSPRMNKRSPKTLQHGESHSISEQTTRDRFKAPLLTELNTRNVDDSPTDGPQENDNDIDSGSRNGGNGSDGSGGGGDGSGVAKNNSATNESNGNNSKLTSSSSSISRTKNNDDNDTFALTPPAIIGAIGSRNLRDEEAKGRLRGIRMRKTRSGSGDNKALDKHSFMSTTAPARSDVGFAHFAKEGVENLFDMDEDVEEEENARNERNQGLEGVREEKDGNENSAGDTNNEEDEEDGDNVGALVSPRTGRRKQIKKKTNKDVNNVDQIDWSSSYASSGLTMSQSYHAPPAGDWWGSGDDLTDSDEEEEAGSSKMDTNTAVQEVEPPTVPSGVMFPRQVVEETKTNNTRQQPGFYGSSVPMAIPSMGGRGKRR